MRTWVLITESPRGRVGINGHANTSADIVDIADAARRELGRRWWSAAVPHHDPRAEFLLAPPAREDSGQ